MSKRPIVLSVALIGIGIVFGIILVSNFGTSSLPSLFAANGGNIGAKSAPVVVSEQARALDDAFVSVSKAVNPTVVSISVITDTKVSNSPLDDFFKFFPGPGGQDQEQEDEEAPRGGTRKGQASGSGVFISEDGYIVTNNHVVEDAEKDKISITTYDRREYTAELIGRDPLTDLAILKVQGNGFSAAHFANKDNIRIGEWVVAVGNPLGLRSTITSGIISAIGRGQLGLSQDRYAVENFIQTDAAINPGNSGGGLFNLQGSLVGINTAIASRTGYYQGYGFAIPVDIVKAVALDIMEDGKVDRGYIGVSIQSIDETAARAVGLDRVTGVIVQEVLKGSPAEKAGVQDGDVILELDGMSVNTSNELQGIVAQHRVGESLKLKIWRNKKMLEKTVRLEPRDNNDDTAENSGNRGDEGSQKENSKDPVKFDKLGFSVEPVSSAIKKDLEVSNGVVVKRVDAYSEAANRGLSPGLVITRAGDQNIESPAQLRDILDKVKPGEAILLQVKAKNGRRLVALSMPKTGS